MFEAFILVCSVYNYTDCRTLKDLNGPYIKIEECHKRIKQMKFDAENELPFVVINHMCTDQFTNPEKHNGNESNTKESRKKLKV